MRRKNTPFVPQPVTDVVAHLAPAVLTPPPGPCSMERVDPGGAGPVHGEGGGDGELLKTLLEAR